MITSSGSLPPHQPSRTVATMKIRKNQRAVGR
jgi:hypothetical protein